MCGWEVARDANGGGPLDAQYLLPVAAPPLIAVPQAAGEGVVVDSSIVKGRGGVADVLVSWGTLKVGDVMVAGTEFGRVRS